MSSLKKRKTTAAQSAQNLLPFGEIRSNSILLKNGGIRGIVKVSTINFNLKTEDEQQSIIVGYQQFLNSLNFPIQIVIQSRKVDLDSYFQMLESQEKIIEHPLLKSQTQDYIAYIKKITEFADIMEKQFFVVVPADPSRKKISNNIFSNLFENLAPQDSLQKVKDRYLEYKGLAQILQKRMDIVFGGLERCGLRVSPLSSKEIIDLLYRSYNPEISQFEKIQDPLEYGVLR